MALKLNQEGEYRQYDEYEIPIFREFYGPNVSKMTELIKAGRFPVSVSGIMQRKLNLRNASDAEVKNAWMNNYFDSGDGVVYHPEGETLVVLDSEHLRKMNSESTLNSGALLLSGDRDEAFAVYEQLKKQENVEAFKKGKFGKTGEWLSRKQAKAHPVWKVLARNQSLLNDFVDYTFAEYRSRFAKDTPEKDVRAMGVFTGSCNGKTPEMRAFYVLRLEIWSYVDGRFDLDCDDGRFVGLAPEAQVAKNIVVPEVRIYTMADVQKAKREIEELTQVRPELIDGTKSLLGKL